jgi:tRNA U34 5-carboxymethylaminomethyl modifying GTPase MnmE/TrmE
MFLAEIEADVDFPDEDIDPKSQHEYACRILRQMSTDSDIGLLATYSSKSKNLPLAFESPLVGKPNVGKSSLIQCDFAT